MAIDVGNVASYQSNSTVNAKPASNVGTVSVENAKSGSVVTASSQSSTTDQAVAIPKVSDIVPAKAKEEDPTNFENVNVNVNVNVKTKETSLKDVTDISKIVNNNTVAEFSYNEPTKRIAIKIKDKSTNEVIKEIPSEKALEMLAKAWELAGIMVDEKR